MPSIDFAEIRATIRTIDYLRALGWFPRFSGSQWSYGPCPVCERGRKREATLSVHRAEGWWRCHRCRKGGGVVEMAMHLTGLPCHPAALALCDQMGREAPHIIRGAR
jgi:hypothetical protein